ncbi:unnamed protein product [Lymnaea stagnalis]|uniref:C-type lectin domain-containing protein n=1 Tax=Lymnaea stagnalis TaxID=6523 RepID=A0AAV2IQX9_LYMST
MAFVFLVMLFAWAAKQDSRFPCFVAANVPSSRTVYYLHTTPAHWTAANSTCTRYGGHLVRAKDGDKLKADLKTLDWHGAFNNLTKDVWTGLYRLEGGRFMWSGCENYTWPGLNPPPTFPPYCYSMDKTYHLKPLDCTEKLPYICQIEEGQCWFLPAEDYKFKDEVKGNRSSADLNACARLCRNYIDPTSECWGFSEESNECVLYNSSARHIYLNEMVKYLDVVASSTVYLKICAGGETTTMNPVPSAARVKPEPENCTQPHKGEAWQEEGVCYCDCDQPPVILTAEYLSLSTDDKINKIVEELLVDASNTSASFRKLNSIDDKRPSAQSLGALGIGVICVVFGGLILLDLNRLISHISSVFCKEETPTSNESTQPREAEINL